MVAQSVPLPSIARRTRAKDAVVSPPPSPPRRGSSVGALKRAYDDLLESFGEVQADRDHWKAEAERQRRRAEDANSTLAWLRRDHARRGDTIHRLTARVDALEGALAALAPPPTEQKDKA